VRLLKNSEEELDLLPDISPQIKESAVFGKSPQAFICKRPFT